PPPATRTPTPRPCPRAPAGPPDGPGTRAPGGDGAPGGSGNTPPRTRPPCRSSRSTWPSRRNPEALHHPSNSPPGNPDLRVMLAAHSGPGGQVAASCPTTSVSSVTAPALESGSLPLPHLGDWMHEGQPVSHSQDRIASRVARSHGTALRKPRSANPAPPA